MRSSATAEDLPDASFAGQQETFLNVVGIDDVLHAIKRGLRVAVQRPRDLVSRPQGLRATTEVALSAGVQRMVRSDTGAAGVMFTIDTESGFEDVVFITSSYGLGETVVQGAVNPDEFYVHKPMLAPDKRALIRRQIGSKLIKMEFAPAGSKERVVTVDVPHGRPQPLFADRRRGARARALRGHDRAALRPPDGHRVGQATATTASSTSCRRGPRRSARR